MTTKVGQAAFWDMIDFLRHTDLYGVNLVSLVIMLGLFIIISFVFIDKFHKKYHVSKNVEKV